MIYDHNVNMNEYVNPTVNVQIRSENNNKFNPEQFLKNKAFENYKNQNDENNQFKFLDISKFTEKLVSMSRSTTAHRCARYVRIALQSAGARFTDHPIAASDWGSTLTEIGYKQIRPAFDNPQEGDIYIINRTSRHRYGHIAGFTGSQWVSDYRQRSHDVYKDPNVTYEYYRLPS
ncbi:MULTISPECIES: CHAP domain-containing protein [Acinetobacter]|uniref:CHAP domain-containing protein n=1 Tax=Acinetobacter wuhouensis TaxID=1879050 RepID=A0A4Q7APZ5_9GAMM|nr:MULTISPECIES: CHAP domain-containing protein [Acinetobacter]RZG47435.1 CHAP domain-containing protein [Acinetobacter wuhouensis]RZG74844.1 CHAP domain-containing protein [Acinetobacter wuhouensis]RZG77565.1 CHAP domain-containing protein [Acinetobacter sp. WCHAc060025]RZG86348.1 CHAP domain-containing protein [Acinetobacter sp. WCHAc060033]